MNMLFGQTKSGPGFTLATNLRKKYLVLMEKEFFPTKRTVERSKFSHIRDNFANVRRNLLNSEEAV